MRLLKCARFLWLAGMALLLVGCAGPSASEEPRTVGEQMRSLWPDEQDSFRRAVEESDFPSATESGIGG
jgi:hypothetical protein